MYSFHLKKFKLNVKLVNSKSSTVIHANMLACAVRGLDGAPRIDLNLRNWLADELSYLFFNVENLTLELRIIPLTQEFG